MSSSAIRKIGWLLAGPAVFALIYSGPLSGLSRQAHLALAVFGWMVTWWMAQPVPWIISSLLPLVLFPLLGLLDFKGTALLYGQRVFFFLFAITLAGYALEKHGLARRLALYLLSIRAIGGSITRLLFSLMLITALLCMFVNELSAIAIMMPIAMGISRYISELLRPADPTDALRHFPRFVTFACLGILYGAESGGVGTPIGLVPHNIISIALLGELTGQWISFVQWAAAGVPLTLVLVVAYFLALRLFFAPEIAVIPGGEAAVRAERDRLPPLSLGEKSAAFAWLVMLVLWLLPTIPTLSQVAWLDIFIVPVFGLVLLFILPADLKKGEATLLLRDVVERAPWNILFLISGALVLASSLQAFGFLDWIAARIAPLVATPGLLPFIAGYATALLTNFVSGTASVTIMATIMFPISLEVGYNPAVLAHIIPNNGVGIIFPWAGAAAGLAFSLGRLRIGDMVKVGIPITIVHVLLTIAVNWALVPLIHGP